MRQEIYVAGGKRRPTAQSSILSGSLISEFFADRCYLFLFVFSWCGFGALCDCVPDADGKYIPLARSTANNDSTATAETQWAAKRDEDDRVHRDDIGRFIGEIVLLI